MAYTDTIRNLDPTVNAVGVECSMRLQYSTLDHLPPDTFREEIEVARGMEAEQPGSLRDLAASYGRAAEYDAAEEQREPACPVCGRGFTIGAVVARTRQGLMRVAPDHPLARHLDCA